jgi:hypothetical protein
MEMTVAEQRFMESMPRYFAEIVEQLKIANQLKALELKGRQDLSITPGMVDDAFDS